MIGLFAALGLSVSLYGQSADVTVVVKGVREAKGKVMVAAGDKAKPQEMIGEMVAVTSTGDVVCVLKNVPVGKTNIYVYQDLNENFQLDMDEQHIPIVGAVGDDWRAACLKRLAHGEDDSIVLPQYGAAAHITQPKK